MKLNGKSINMKQLEGELLAAGVQIRALGQVDDDLHTYTASGSITDVPANAAAVVAAHVPAPANPRLRDALASWKGTVGRANNLADLKAALPQLADLLSTDLDGGT
jgi:hypothetical protein